MTEESSTPLQRYPEQHTPVLLQEVMDLCAQQKPPRCFLDATFGRGGHTERMLSQFPDSRVVALDRDPEAIQFAKEVLCPKYPGRLFVAESRFSHMKEVTENLQKEHETIGPLFSAILFDLGVSSPQIDTPARGFSFAKEGPLDMRMGRTSLQAKDLLNQETEQHLADIFFYYGEERHSRKLAKAVVMDRQKKSFTTTQQLAQLVVRILGKNPKNPLHPATRVFQALRIAVNEELEEIQSSLPIAASLLRPQGCLMAISFHSLEDRLIKHFFRHDKDTSFFATISKKPITPSPEEIAHNSRSRSAKLRWGIRSSPYSTHDSIPHS